MLCDDDIFFAADIYNINTHTHTHDGYHERDFLKHQNFFT